MRCDLLDAGKFSAEERAVLNQAAHIIEAGVGVEAVVLSSPSLVRDWLAVQFSALEREMFGVILLDAQNRLIDIEVLFAGTLTQTTVFPREVVKAALACNAAAIMLVHNHPSGCAEPSRADEILTQALKQASALVHTKVLDHFIVAGTVVLSFAERGLL